MKRSIRGDEGRDDDAVYAAPDRIQFIEESRGRMKYHLDNATGLGLARFGGSPGLMP